MKIKPIYLLIPIVVLGLIIRIYKLTSLPMYGDELTIAYDSYSILNTGKDQTGEPFPLTFKMGAGRPPGYVYGSIPFIALFGPTAWGVRTLSIVSGLGIVVLMYFVGKKLFDEKIGLLTSFLASISMWDIYLSRAGFEAHFALFLALFGVLMFLEKRYLSMALLWGLAIFTYPTFKLTIPLLFLALILYKGIKKTFKNKNFVISLLVLAIFGGLTLNETFKGVSEERFLRLNIFSDEKLVQSITQDINEKRNLSDLPQPIKPLVYNKPLRYTRILFENYIENLSPSFLFLRGDRNPRPNPGEWGMLYLVELPLLFAGLFYLKNDDNKKFGLLLAWIIIVPLATMFLGQSHALRNNLMVPPFLLISALALSKMSWKISTVCIVLMLVQLFAVLTTVYYYAPNKFGSFWSAKAMSTSLKATENKDKYDKVVLSTKIDNIEYAYPVYARLNPEVVIEQYGKLPKIYGNIVITDNLKEYEGSDNILILDD